MPRKIDLRAFLARLKKARPDATHGVPCSLPTDAATRAVQLAIANNVDLTSQVRHCVEEYLRAHSSGVVVEFDRALTAYVVVAAANLGLDRGELVKLIVNDHIADYLRKAIEKRKRAKALAAELESDETGKRLR